MIVVSNDQSAFQTFFSGAFSVGFIFSDDILLACDLMNEVINFNVSL